MLAESWQVNIRWPFRTWAQRRL